MAKKTINKISKTKKSLKKGKITKKNNRVYISLLAISILLIAFAALIFLVKHQTASVIQETEKTEVKKLPKEIKKQLLSASVSASFKIPILMYHYVEYVQDKKDTTRLSLDINPYIFEQQVLTLKSAGYTFMTAGELAEVFDGKKLMPGKPVLLTFDDGHWDLDTDVLPILKKYNVKATAYIITGFLNGSDFLSTDQLKEVASSGLVEIGSHTVHHAWLKGKTVDFDKNELEESKTFLEQLLGKPIISFAYPYGAFDQRAADEVKDAGYKTAVITVPGEIDSINNRYFLFRLRPGGRTGKELLNYLEQTTFKPW